MRSFRPVRRPYERNFDLPELKLQVQKLLSHSARQFRLPDLLPACCMEDENPCKETAWINSFDPLPDRQARLRHASTMRVIIFARLLVMQVPSNFVLLVTW